MRFFLFVCFLGAALAGLLGSAAEQTVSEHKTVVETADGSRFEFTTELALTPEDQALGLMYREHFADDRAMLFPFPRSRRASFWMRNVPIPLDIIFIRRNGKIANIAGNAEPMTDSARLSKGKVIAVLEVRGGLTEELGIKAGDQVFHPDLKKRKK